MLLLLALQAFPPDPEMPAYTLPELKPRAETLELFRTHVYGRVPSTPFKQLSQMKEKNPNAMGGAATLKRLEIILLRGGDSLTIQVSLFTPNKAKAPATFLLICNRPPDNIDPTREKKSPFWPAEEVVARGYGIAAFHVGDVDPDKHDGFKDGAHKLLDVEPRGPDAWGTIAAWAWGASRVMDYLETDGDVGKVAVIGHSRGGKTALWAGAQDERFAMAISSCSGNSGAAISRRRFAGKESVARINKAFPHWFCETYKSYGSREDALPVDQHQLVALLAPRAVAIGSAADDLHADPRGEFLSASIASAAWAPKKGLGTSEMPPIGKPVDGEGVHYHIREGKHDLTLYDWERYMDFADKTLR
ncbi:MAG TPA: acetylxylan esterase [Planctomycetota bacterium]